MFKLKYVLIAASLVSMGWVPHADAGGRGSALPPVVDSVEVDHALHQLKLSGRYFGGSAPLVTLGKHRLEVSQSTQTEVVAKLPARLRSATYRLSVNNSQTATESNAFYLPIQTAVVTD